MFKQTAMKITGKPHWHLRK